MVYAHCMPREIGAWTQDKLKVIEDYLPVYLDATGSASERVYIDAFAGPGANALTRDGEAIEVIDGSPLIALDATGPRNGRGFDRLFFIESDEPSIQELRAAVAERDEYNRAEVIHGDVNLELPRLMGRINKKSPTFVLIDPAGIDPAWATIKTLADWRTELLINFPLGMSINRNPDSPKVDAYFGTTEWRKHWDGMRLSRTSGLIRLYLERLADLGWSEQPDHARLVKGDGNQYLYYLLFASKHEAGERIMSWAFGQPNAAGQARLRLQFPGE